MICELPAPARKHVSLGNPGTKSDAEALRTEARVRVIPTAISRTAVPGAADGSPRSAAIDAVRTVFGACRVLAGFGVCVELLVVPVVTPLRHVSVHVMQTERIRFLEGPDRCGLPERD